MVKCWAVYSNPQAQGQTATFGEKDILENRSSNRGKHTPRTISDVGGSPSARVRQGESLPLLGGSFRSILVRVALASVELWVEAPVAGREVAREPFSEVILVPEDCTSSQVAT